MSSSFTKSSRQKFPPMHKEVWGLRVFFFPFLFFQKTLQSKRWWIPCMVMSGYAGLCSYEVNGPLGFGVQKYIRRG